MLKHNIFEKFTNFDGAIVYLFEKKWQNTPLFTLVKRHIFMVVFWRQDYLQYMVLIYVVAYGFFKGHVKLLFAIKKTFDFALCVSFICH